MMVDELCRIATVKPTPKHSTMPSLAATELIVNFSYHSKMQDKSKQCIQSIPIKMHVFCMFWK